MLSRLTQAGSTLSADRFIAVSGDCYSPNYTHAHTSKHGDFGIVDVLLQWNGGTLRLRDDVG